MSEEHNDLSKKTATAPGWFSLEQVSVYVLGALVVLVPIALIPSPSFPFVFTKLALAGLLILFATILVSVVVLREKKLTLHKSPIVFSVWLLAAAYSLSFLLSEKVAGDFLGERITGDSAVFIVLGALLTTLAASLLQTRARALTMLLAMLIPALLLVLFFLVRVFFGVEVLSFNIFQTLEANPLGTLTDFSVFFGLIAILSLLGITLLRMQGLWALVQPVTLAISLLVLMVANIALLWWLLSAVALAMLAVSVYAGVILEPGKKRAEKKSDELIERHTGGAPGLIASLLVLGIAASFLFGGQGLSGMVANWFNVGEQSIRPSWSVSTQIAQDTLKEDALFGSGPSTFGKQWALHRPESLNETIVWAVDFNSAVGYIPTALTTTGILGILMWLLLAGALIYTAVRLFVSKVSLDPISFYLCLTSFAASVYLFTMAVLTPLSVPLVLYLFFFLGLFAACALITQKTHAGWQIDFLKHPRPGFLIVLALTVINLGLVIAGFQLVTRFSAAVHMQKSSVAFASGDVVLAQQEAGQAISLYESSNYFRLLALTNQELLAQLIARAQDPSQEERERFQELLNQAVGSAERAAQLDPNDYRAWLSLARVNALVVPLNVEGAYDNAMQAYERAGVLRPYTPYIALERAQLALSAEQEEVAQTFIDEALSQRQQYADALFLLSQLRIRAGELPEAIAAIERAVVSEPNNIALLFQLGLLYYASERYQDASAVLERTLSLQSDYANAKYFLGLAQYRQGNTQGAIAQFEGVLTLNPGNQEVVTILEKLRAGEDPFAGVEPPEDILEEEVPVSDAENTNTTDVSEVSQSETVPVQ